MVRDVLPRGAAAAPVGVGDPGDDDRPQPLQGSRHQVRDLGAEHGEEVAERTVRRVRPFVPGAGEVGLAEADQLVPGDPGEQLVRPVDVHLRSAATQRLGGVRRARGDVHGDVEPADRRPEQAPRDPGADPAVGSGVEVRSSCGRGGGRG